MTDEEIEAYTKRPAQNYIASERAKILNPKAQERGTEMDGEVRNRRNKRKEKKERAGKELEMNLCHF